MPPRAMYVVAALASLVLLTLSLTKTIANDWTEVLAVITGAWCVWLTVKENIWNWPIGLANATFSGIVFFGAKFYADSVLQGIYFVLGLFGWYWWLHGGQGRTEIRVKRAPLPELIIVLLVGAISTFAIRKLLIHYNGAAPFLDAALTSFSLVAQYLLTRKYLENWLVWIVVDIVYIPLLASRGLVLMAVLYSVFLVLAILGYLEWRRKFLAQTTFKPAL